MHATQKRKKGSRSPSPNPDDKRRRVDDQDTDMTVLEDRNDTVPTPTVSLDDQSPTVPEQPDIPTIHRRDVLVPQHTATQSHSQADNTPTLTSLLMRSDPLDTLIKGGGTWPKIAVDLSNFFLPKQRELEDEVGSYEAADYVVELCTAYYSNQGAKTTTHKLGQELDEQAESTKVSDVVSFLKDFMEANGQWDYIRGQDWFQNGSFVIAIDLNYYPNRSGYKETPLFHKDTGGNNIFVNLIFDNERPIESTEWFEDVAPPSTERAKWQKALLPGSHLDRLDEARDALAAALKKEEEQTGQKKPVSGGVSEGSYIFVSWLDDLAWHATPTDSARLELTNDIAQSLYGQLDKASHAVEPTDFGYVDYQLNRTIRGIEILGTMAEVEGTKLDEWLKSQGLKPQDIDSAVAQDAWRALYSSTLPNGAGPVQYAQDVATRAKAPWRITGEVSIANAEDPNLEGQGSVQIDETPMGLSTRRRANSLPGNQQRIRDVREANKETPRAFIRTWVRILNKESKEAKEGLPGTDGL